METSRLSDTTLKIEPSQTVPRESGDQPAGQRRIEAASNGQAAADRAEFTTRAQIEVARGRAGGATGDGERRGLVEEAGNGTRRAQRPAPGTEAIADEPSAGVAAREASNQIRAHPALAALAQANSAGAAVLAMLA